VGCTVCAEWEKAYAEVALLARRQLGAMSENVFFAQVSYSQAPEAFNKFKLMHAPVLTFFASDSEVKRLVPKDTTDLTRLDIVFPDPIAAFVSKAIGKKVEIVHSPWQRVAVLTFFMLFCIFGGRRFLLIFVPLMRRSKWLWLVVSIFLYGVGVSGLVYSYLTGVPNYAKDPKTGTIQYFSDEQSQFVYEGIVIWLLLVVGGLFLVGSASDFIPTPEWHLLQSTVNLLLLLGFVVAFRQYVHFYSLKTPWYAYAIQDRLTMLWMPRPQ